MAGLRAATRDIRVITHSGNITRVAIMAAIGAVPKKIATRSKFPAGVMNDDLVVKKSHSMKT